MQPCRREVRVNRGGGEGNSQAGAPRGTGELQSSPGLYLHGGWRSSQAVGYRPAGVLWDSRLPGQSHLASTTENELWLVWSASVRESELEAGNMCGHGAVRGLQEPFVHHEEHACGRGVGEQRYQMRRTRWRPFSLMFGNRSRGCLLWNPFALPFFLLFYFIFFSPWWNFHGCTLVSLKLRSESTSIRPALVQMLCSRWNSLGSWLLLLPVRNSRATCFGFETLDSVGGGGATEGRAASKTSLSASLERGDCGVALGLVFFCCWCFLTGQLHMYADWCYRLWKLVPSEGRSVTFQNYSGVRGPKGRMSLWGEVQDVLA